jgi:hypothetical protein
VAASNKQPCAPCRGVQFMEYHSSPQGQLRLSPEYSVGRLLPSKACDSVLQGSVPARTYLSTAGIQPSTTTDVGRSYPLKWYLMVFRDCFACGTRILNPDQISRWSCPYWRTTINISILEGLQAKTWLPGTFKHPKTVWLQILAPARSRLPATCTEQATCHLHGAGYLPPALRLPATSHKATWHQP